MKRSVSFSASAAALVLFASTLVAPVTASAADRQIVVTPKVKTFRVDDGVKLGATDVAATEEVEAPSKVKPKAFTVDDSNDQADNDPVIKPNRPDRPDRPDTFTPDKFTVEDEGFADNTPVTTPKRPKTQEFRVDDEETQAADAPDFESGDETAELKPDFKPKQPKVKPPVVSEDDSEEDAAIAEDDEETYEEPPVRVKRRVYYAPSPRKYVVYNSYRRNHGYNAGYSYRAARYGSSCNQQNYGY